MGGGGEQPLDDHWTSGSTRQQALTNSAGLQWLAIGACLHTAITQTRRHLALSALVSSRLARMGMQMPKGLRHLFDVVETFHLCVLHFNPAPW